MSDWERWTTVLPAWLQGWIWRCRIRAEPPMKTWYGLGGPPFGAGAGCGSKNVLRLVAAYAHKPRTPYHQAAHRSLAEKSL